MADPRRPDGAEPAIDGDVHANFTPFVAEEVSSADGAPTMPATLTQTVGTRDGATSIRWSWWGLGLIASLTIWYGVARLIGLV
jgi:hypothetical protein